MMRKKLSNYGMSAAVLMLTASMLPVSACGKAPEKETVAPIEALTEETSASQAEEETSKAAQETTSAAPKQPEGATFHGTATIEPTVLVDENGIKITANDIKYANNQIQLGLTLENNTEKDISVTAGTIGYSVNSINGYMMRDGYVNADIAPGMKSNETVYFDTSELELMGVTDVADIEIGFNIDDKDYNNIMKTGPIAIKTSLADSYDCGKDSFQEALNTGNFGRYGADIVTVKNDEIYNQNGIVIGTEALLDKDGNQLVILEAENTGAQPVNLRIGSIEINGLVITSGDWEAQNVNAGKKLLISESLDNLLPKEAANAVGISDIKSLGLDISQKDLDYNDILDPMPVSVAFTEDAGEYAASGTPVVDENGVQITPCGGYVEEYGGLKLLYILKNTSNAPVTYDVAYGTFAANSFMIDPSVYSKTAAPGKSVLLEVEIFESDMEKNNITKLEDITDVQFTLEMKDQNYHTIGEEKVAVKY